jgi:hypothetical protein
LPRQSAAAAGAAAGVVALDCRIAGDRALYAGDSGGELHDPETGKKAGKIETAPFGNRKGRMRNQYGHFSMPDPFLTLFRPRACRLDAIHYAIMKTTSSSTPFIRASADIGTRVRSKFLFAVAVSVVLGTPYSGTTQTLPPRQPVGLYAIVTVSTCVEVGNDSATAACVSNKITAVVTNCAISGVLAYLQWSDLCPSVPAGSTNSTVGTNDWAILDAIFGAVQQWNAANPTNIPKTIQLEILPGFKTPQWVFNNMTSCDAMFLTNSQGSIVNTNPLGQLVLVGVNTNNVTSTCGCATFLESENHTNQPLRLLPLPWNSYYKQSWKSYIQAVAARYGTNPLLVSVNVAGPTASSSEMILPNETNDTTNYLKWNPMLALEFPNDPSITNSDMKFIKEWEDAIDVFGNAFSNLTLIVTTGSGLPNFLMTNGLPYTNYSVLPGFCPDCALSDTNAQANIMDCAAETTILAYFADPQHGGNNAKATQADGLSANAIHVNPLGGGDLGAHGIKWLAQNTTSGNAPLPGTTNIVSRVLGGLQIGAPGGGAIITQNPDTTGCNLRGGGCTNISPEQAIYNVLAAFFDGTPLGTNYGSSQVIVSSNYPLNYLQIYDADVLYANTNNAGSLVVDGYGNTNNLTAEMLFSNANFQISEIAEVDLELDIQVVGQNVQLTWLATTPAACQLLVNHKLSDANGWKPASQTPTIIGDYCQVTINPTAAASFFRLAPP